MALGRVMIPWGAGWRAAGMVAYYSESLGLMAGSTASIVRQLIQEGKDFSWISCTESHVSSASAGARRPFGKLRAGSRDSRRDAGATIGWMLALAVCWTPSLTAPWRK